MLPVVAALVAVTVFVAATGLDLTLSAQFYDPQHGWTHQNDAPWSLLYHYGNIPAISMGVAGFLLFVASFWWLKAAPYRKIALFFTLALILGPGLIVNTVFKNHWGRPRPRQVELFAGPLPYHQVWEKGVAGEGKSFPSGHASVGFFLFTPYFVLRRTSKKWARIFLAAGLCYGALMGLMRIVQGGHFLSDVIWSAGFVYLSGVLVYYLLRMDRTIWWEGRGAVRPVA